MHDRGHGGGGRCIDRHDETAWIDGATEWIAHLRLRHLTGHHFLYELLLVTEWCINKKWLTAFLHNRKLEVIPYGLSIV